MLWTKSYSSKIYYEVLNTNVIVFEDGASKKVYRLNTVTGMKPSFNEISDLRKRDTKLTSSLSLSTHRPGWLKGYVRNSKKKAIYKPRRESISGPNRQLQKGLLASETVRK